MACAPESSLRWTAVTPASARSPDDTPRPPHASTSHTASRTRTWWFMRKATTCSDCYPITSGVGPCLSNTTSSPRCSSSERRRTRYQRSALPCVRKALSRAATSSQRGARFAPSGQSPKRTRKRSGPLSPTPTSGACPTAPTTSEGDPSLLTWPDAGRPGCCSSLRWATGRTCTPPGYSSRISFPISCAVARMPPSRLSAPTRLGGLWTLPTVSAA